MTKGNRNIVPASRVDIATKVAPMKLFVLIAIAFGLLSAPAIAQTAEQQQACTDDAFRLCGAFIPDRERVTVCMIQNKNKVGPACLAVMAHYSQPGNSAKATAHRSIKAENARAEAN